MATESSWRRNVSVQNLKTMGLLLALILLVLVQQCSQPTDPVFNNPNDSLTAAFVAPEMILTQGPPEGLNWPVRRASFAWSGNTVTAMYSYKLDTAGWSPWSSSTSVEFESLDDDTHLFSVKGQHSNGSNETVPRQRTFIIDLLPHPSFFVVPNLTRPKMGNRFYLYLRVKNIDSLMTMRTVLRYSRNVFSVEDVVADGTFMTKNHGTIVPIISHDANAGMIDVNLGVALGSPKGIQGTGNLLRIQCLAIATGTDSLRILPDSTVVRDTSNVSVHIAGYANGIVVVQ